MSRPILLALALVLSLAGVAQAKGPPAPAVRWQTDTRSPRRTDPPAGRDAALYASCGARDAGLTGVAARVAERRVAGGSAWSSEELRELTRAAGVPQPWPRAWSIAGKHSEQQLGARLRRWLHQGKGYRRCGIARGVDGAGRQVVAAVVVDAVADLASFPTRARASQWLSLDAVVHLPAAGAKVVLLGPLGRPRRILTSLSNGRVRSRFRLDMAGRWLVQVLADTAGGPLPVLEAVTFVEQAPPTTLPRPPRAVKTNLADDAWLLGQLAADRKRAGLPAMRRDSVLDRLALRHAKAMLAKRRVAHDLGDGGPRQRLEGAGLEASQVGENVASAESPQAAHQALWSSPSHRENMLDASFGRVGVAALRDRAGRVWVVQLFTR